MTKYKRLYRLLIRAGHEPAKALEIIFDAKRHGMFATQWVWLMFWRRHSI